MPLEAASIITTSTSLLASLLKGTKKRLHPNREADNEVLTELDEHYDEIIHQQAAIKAEIRDRSKRLHEIIDNRQDELVIQLDQITRKKLKSLAVQIGITTFGRKGTSKGELDWPRGIAVDGSGLVYVSVYNNHHVSVFTSEGGFVTSFTEGVTKLNAPRGIAVGSNGVVYVSLNNCIEKF